MRTALLLLTALSPARVAAGDGVARKADLERLAEWVDMDRSFTDAKREEARRAIARYLAESTPFTDAAFYMELRRIVGLADNGHTNVEDEPIHARFGLLPLRAYWFSDGLYVVRARSPHAALVGARLQAVEGRPIAELEKRLMEYHGGSVEHFRHDAAASLMLSPALLHAIGLAASPDRLRLEVVDRAGATVEAIVPVDLESSTVVAQPWRYLNPAPIGDGAPWATVLDPAGKLPLYLQDEAERFRYVRLEEVDLAYVQLRANFGIHDFAQQTVERLQQDHPRSIVLDNRDNGGGDLTQTADFALELPSFAGPGGRVYVITGNGTFSAGIYSSFYPKASDPEHTLVVGEPVGDWPRFWAETGPPFRLPESGFRISYAIQMHDVAEGCFVPETCHMAQYAEHWNLAVKSLAPDWPVPTTFADFAAGRDPVLERILESEATQR